MTPETPGTEAGRALLGDSTYSEPDCEHPSASFDRTLCACGSMHDYCDKCGQALGCPLNTPEARAEYRRQQAIPILAIEAEARASLLAAAREGVRGLGTARSWSDKADRQVWQSDVLALLDTLSEVPDAD